MGVNKNEHRKFNQEGFTIVELMIATVVFSLVLLVCSMAIVHVGRMYYKGMVMNKTQDTARQIVDDVAQAIQFRQSGGEFSKDIVGYSGPEESLDGEDGGDGEDAWFNGLICIGSNRYKFNNFDMRGDSDADGVSDKILRRSFVNSANCQTEGGDEPEALTDKELIGKNMRLPVFDVVPPGDKDKNGNILDENLWTVMVTVSYGEADDFESAIDPDPDNGIEGVPAFSICKGVNAGGQFCAVSSYTVKVKPRLL